MNIKAIFWHSEQRRMRAILRILIQFFLAQLVMLAIMFVFGIISGDGFMAFAEPSTLTQYLLGGVAMVCSAVLSLMLVAKSIDKRPFGDYGIKFDGHWHKDLIAGLLLGLLMAALVFVIEWGNGWVTIEATFVVKDIDAGFFLSLLSVFFFFACVGINEELIFRGFQIKNMAEGLTSSKISHKHAVFGALLISSAIFGVVHAGNPDATLVSVLNILVGGLFLGLAYVWTGNLAMPIGLHTAWNFSIGNVFGLPVSGLTSPSETVTLIKSSQIGPEIWTGGKFGPEAGMVYLLVLLIGIATLWWWIKQRNGCVEIHEQFAVYAPKVADVQSDNPASMPTT